MKIHTEKTPTMDELIQQIQKEVEAARKARKEKHKI